MPYILKVDANRLTIDYSKASNQLGLTSGPETSGELNFCMTQLAVWFLKHEGENYDNYDKTIGAFMCAMLELYRRKIAPYEDTKKQDPERIDPYE
jgi:hypothetical protein